MKKIIVLLIGVGLLMGLSGWAMAGSIESGHCSLKDGNKGYFRGGKGPRWDKMGCCLIVSKILKKSDMILKNKSTLSLSEVQIKEVEGLRDEAQKAADEQKASKEKFMDELKAKLREEKVDADQINAMIDSHFSQMASAMKAGVSDFAKLKAVLTPDQKAKMKEMWKEKEGRRKGCGRT